MADDLYGDMFKKQNKKKAKKEKQTGTLQINSVPYYAHPNSKTMINVGQVSPALPLPIKQIELIANNHFKRYIDELNSRVYEVMGDQVIDKLKQSNIDVNCPS